MVTYNLFSFARCHQHKRHACIHQAAEYNKHLASLVRLVTVLGPENGPDWSQVMLRVSAKYKSAEVQEPQSIVPDLRDRNHHQHHHQQHLKSFVSVLSTGRTVPPIEYFYSYERWNSIGVLERLVFTGRMPFLAPNQAHQVCKVTNNQFKEIYKLFALASVRSHNYYYSEVEILKLGKLFISCSGEKIAWHWQPIVGLYRIKLNASMPEFMLEWLWLGAI